MGPRAGLDGRKISSPPGFVSGSSSPLPVATPTELQGPQKIIIPPNKIPIILPVLSSSDEEMQQSRAPQLYHFLCVKVSPSCQFILFLHFVKQLDYQKYVPQKSVTRKCVGTLRQLAVFSLPPHTFTCIIYSILVKITNCGRFLTTLYSVILVINQLNAQILVL